MTIRINGFWVALEEDVREDDAEATLAAVRQLRGVLAVELNIACAADFIAERRVRRDMTKKVQKLLDEL